MLSVWQRLSGFILALGAYPGESESHRTKWPIFVGATIIASVLTLPQAFDLVARGLPKLAFSLWSLVIAGPVAPVILALRPRWFGWLVNGKFTLVVASGRRLCANGRAMTHRRKVTHLSTRLMYIACH